MRTYGYVDRDGESAIAAAGTVCESVPRPAGMARISDLLAQPGWIK